MNIFQFFIYTKFQQNILQNAPNCRILKKFLGGACPKPPQQTYKRFSTCKYPHFSKNILNPLPPK